MPYARSAYPAPRNPEPDLPIRSVEDRPDLLRRRILCFLRRQHVAPVGPVVHFLLEARRYKILPLAALPASAQGPVKRN